MKYISLSLCLPSSSVSLSLPLTGCLKCQGRKTTASLQVASPSFLWRKKGSQLVPRWRKEGSRGDSNSDSDISKIWEISSLWIYVFIKESFWILFGYLRRGSESWKSCSHVAFPEDRFLPIWDRSRFGVPWRGAEPVLCRPHEGGHRYRLVIAWVG